MVTGLVGGLLVKIGCGVAVAVTVGVADPPAVGLVTALNVVAVGLAPIFASAPGSTPVAKSDAKTTTPAAISARSGGGNQPGNRLACIICPAATCGCPHWRGARKGGNRASQADRKSSRGRE